MNSYTSPLRSFSLRFLVLVAFFGIMTISGGADAPSSDPLVPLTPHEQEWLSTHQVLRVCPDPSYPPFELITPDGSYEGISADLLRVIANRLGLTLEIISCKNWSQCIEKIQNREVDILGAVYISDLRNAYLLYSTPYYSAPLYIITKNTVPSDLTLSDLDGRAVAVVNGYTAHLLLKEKYPTVNPIVVSDIPEGLEKVAFGSADAYLGDLATASYYTEKLGLVNLKVSGEVKTPDQTLQHLAFGIRSDQPTLVSILNKTLQSISEKEKKVIFSRWIPPSLTPPLVSTHLLLATAGIVAFCLIIIGTFFIWNRSLRTAVAEKTNQLVEELEEKKRILVELEQKNTELSGAYEQLAATEEELKQQYYQLADKQEELRSREERLRQVRFSIDQSHDLIFWISLDGTIRDFSNRVLSTLGFTKEELISMNMSAIDQELSSEYAMLKCETSCPVPVRYETEFLTKSGEKLPMEVSLISYEYADETIILLSARDIRERKMMEELKRGAFTQIDKNIEQFAILNDQIRNPLTLLMIYAEEMDSPDGEKILEQINRIDQLVDRLDRGLLESEKVRRFLRKYYHDLPAEIPRNNHNDR